MGVVSVSGGAFNAFHSLTEHENPANGPCLETLVTKCEASLYQCSCNSSCPARICVLVIVSYLWHASGRAVASREWYHTASAMMKQFPERRLVPLSNCGSYSVRGDWSLAVAAGSRSEIVAHRALDPRPAVATTCFGFKMGLVCRCEMCCQMFITATSRPRWAAASTMKSSGRSNSITAMCQVARDAAINSLGCGDHASSTTKEIASTGDAGLPHD